ncbi:PDZ domain-containing protein, partial [Nitrospina gracilis]|nr:PDZ domain-containing protein [Nitrospina gracilis]
MLLKRHVTGLILIIFLNSFWLISCATAPNQQSSTSTTPKVRNSAELAKKENRGWLGVYTKPVTPQQIKANHLTDSGILIHNIEKDGPADIGGIKKGDILIKIDGQNIPFKLSLGVLQKTIKSAGYGKSVKVEVVRNGRK